MATPTKTSKPSSPGSTNAGNSGATATLSRKIRPGFVSHTELASSNPAATKTWCEKTLGWKFGEPMPTPEGPYHMWQFAENQGGGIRGTNPSESPGSVPYCEVEDINAAVKSAVKNGAKQVLAPQEVPGNGWIAVVQAPGGVAIGFWGQR